MRFSFEDVEVVCCLFLKLAASCGLEVSFSAGRSEAILHFIGRSAEAGRKLLAELELDEAGVSALTPLSDGGHLRVVDSCRHLGTQVSSSVSLTREISQRTSAAAAAHAALAKPLLAKSTVGVSGRSLVAAACVHSRLLYLSGS